MGSGVGNGRGTGVGLTGDLLGSFDGENTSPAVGGNDGPNMGRADVSD